MIGHRASVPRDYHRSAGLVRLMALGAELVASRPEAPCQAVQAVLVGEADGAEHLIRDLGDLASRPADEGRTAATAMAALSTATEASPLAAMTLPRDRTGEDLQVRRHPNRDVDGFFGDELEQRGRALAGLLDPAADRRHDLLGLGDALAIAARAPGRNPRNCR
jgi:hypothetical protein